jgi:signal transduction histidine kinase
VIATDLIERLAKHAVLGSAPQEELAWLAEHASFRRLDVGEILSHRGKPVEGMFVILSGRLALYGDRGDGPTKMVEWEGGDVSGMLPFSRMQNAPGDSIVQEQLEVLALPRDDIREMTRECFTLTSLLVHRMLDRTRLLTSSELHNEKMISLGKLSAGLAHELNNPASAIERSVCLLTDRLEEAESAARALEAARLSEEQLAAVDAVREACRAKARVARSALEQVDREDAMTDWLEKRSLDSSMAPILAETEVTFEALNQLAQTVPGQALNPVLRWAAAGCAVRSLASEIQGCSTRISSLVMAIKGFTHMDQGTGAQRLELAEGLSDAVAVLNAKATQRSIVVVMNVSAGLPQVLGYTAELNQIWGILIDNALDAAPDDGRVEVSARREGQRLVVRIIDDGEGIPAEIKSRVFDPFFTTKPLGSGTGLGLDIARRLVRHNDGVIEFDSRAGRTEFRVSLPAVNSAAAAG